MTKHIQKKLDDLCYIEDRSICHESSNFYEKNTSLRSNIKKLAHFCICFNATIQYNNLEITLNQVFYNPYTCLYLSNSADSQLASSGS